MFLNPLKLNQIPMTRTVAVRVIADILLVQAALIAAFGARYILFALDPGEVNLPQLAARFTAAYVRSFWMIGLVAVPVFAASGFYTRGRMYRSRYKILMVVQAVSFVYAVFAGMAFLANNWFDMPRGVIPLGWLATVGFVAGARVFSVVWEGVLATEGRLFKRRALEDIKVRTVLVIGGGGYIGSALLPRLLDHGLRVRLLDLMLFGDEPIGQCINHENLEIIRSDFRQIDSIVQAMRGVDAVIHLGAIVGDPACSVDEELTVDVNLMATRVIAEVARGEGVQRMVFASTCSVYGAGDEILSEQSALRPVSLYARTKLASERVLQELASLDFAPVILRFGTIYGLSGRTRFDLVINLLTAKAIRDGEITIFGGDQWRPFVPVDDAARAVFKALTAPLPAVRNEIFNVGSDEQNFTISQVGDIIADLIPGSKVVSMGEDTDRRNYRVDFAKTRKVLGFEPEWTVEKGVRQVEAAIGAGFVKDYKEARYSNLKSLTDSHGSKFFRPKANWPLVLLRADQIEDVPDAEPAKKEIA